MPYRIHFSWWMYWRFRKYFWIQSKIPSFSEMYLRYGTYVWLPWGKRSSRTRRHRCSGTNFNEEKMYFDQMYSKCILNFQNILANIDGLVSADSDNNPYMDGQKLPVAAKKGNFWSFEKTQTSEKDDHRKFLLLLLFHFETFQLPSLPANILEKRAVSTKMFEPSYDFENMLTKHPLSSVTKQILTIQTENTYIWTKLLLCNTDQIKSQLVHVLFL